MKGEEISIPGTQTGPRIVPAVSSSQHGGKRKRKKCHWRMLYRLFESYGTYHLLEKGLAEMVTGKKL